ncbi:related to CSN12-COP9 signalosome (CSN) subunit [Sporisorium reilianum SRZ2]|uniref:Related to CSN12-COP9 signalosome (CSN) subunit n=2 Tax=Sporisorium reilianum TaxID=72558 RepID=E7A2V4_SPORE|nr:related to CSN12-COP9 signalosome (CSN) subunit [Sporisorium reilianum SRZ2]SJX63717.1 related to CSN12-COP9 signalosome (CSN) subunit [Sporisorium reilianum f. sp. reilianum]
MKPSIFADAVLTAAKHNDGHSLAQLFAIGGPVAASALLELGDPRPARIISALRKCSGYLAAPWEDMCVHHLTSVYSFALASSLVGEAVDAEGKTRAERLGEAFEAYNAAVTAFVRFFATLSPGRWAVPLLRILCLNLRWLAVQADAASLAVTSVAQGQRTSSQPNRRLEECARQLNKAFTACIADRNPELADSRKWGTYEVVGMVFKTYFRLKSVALCRNILRAISAAALPDLAHFPKSQQVTFRYYVGVLAFLNEEYDRAERELDAALAMCHRSARANQALILTYLVPVKLLKGSLPHPALLDSDVGEKLHVYTPFIAAVRTGDIRTFDTALHTHEATLVKRGTFIAIERARDVALRTLLKRISLSLPRPAPTAPPPTRIGLKTLHAATSGAVVGLQYGDKELEWILATLIYKGYVKGYIAHERGVLVLSSVLAFPLLRDVPIATT